MREVYVLTDMVFNVSKVFYRIYCNLIETAKGKEEKIKGVRYDNIISRRNNSEGWVCFNMTTLQTAAIIRYDNCYCLKLKPRTDMVIDTLKTTQARYMLQPTKVKKKKNTYNLRENG